MTTGIFVGIDSGGTLTNVSILVIDKSGASRSASYEVGESLSGALPPSHIPRVLNKIFAPLEMQIDDLAAEGLPCYAWVSAAGFTPWTREDYVSAFYALAPTTGQGKFRSIGVANDAVSLLLGFRANGIVIAGTGSSVVLKSPDGTLYQAGGHEWVACDSGSGFWIGLQTIRQAYRDFEAGIDSALLQRVRQVYGVRHDDARGLIAKMRDLAIGDPNMKKEIAKVAAFVVAAAERGDVGAQNIVKAEAEALADVTAEALRRRFTKENQAAGLRLVQCGSLLGNAFYRACFEAQLDMRLRSGINQGAIISWERVTTGGKSAIQLAQDIDGKASEMLRLDIAFRPAIVTF